MKVPKTPMYPGGTKRGGGGDELAAFWKRVCIVKSCFTKFERTHKMEGANFFNGALLEKIPYYNTGIFWGVYI